MRNPLLFPLIVLMLLLPAGSFALTAGQEAPSFRAPSTRGPVHLADFLGKKHVVLAFYYRDFTPV